MKNIIVFLMMGIFMFAGCSGSNKSNNYNAVVSAEDKACGTSSNVKYTF